MRVTVRVPASIANLGPGFDVLALAVQLQDEVRVESAQDGWSVDPGADAPPALRDPAQNLLVRGYRAVADSLGVPPVVAHFVCRREIPVARGLGSSAAATLAGVLAGVAMHHAPWDEQDVLAAAAAFEGHRDNVAASLLGGLAIAAPDAAAVQVAVPEHLRAVVLVPDAPLQTSAARGVVPRAFSREDAMFNAARCALLVRALTIADSATLGAAMEDRWHQRARAALMPWAEPVIAAARACGAGAAMAGAGPSIVALTFTAVEPVRAAMEKAARECGCDAGCLVLEPRNYGTRVDVRP